MSKRRLKAVGLGIIFIGLFWLRGEELNTNLVTLFGVFVTGWIVTNAIIKKNNYINIKQLIIPFAWFFSPVTILLMMLKNGIHGHGFPEYSILQTIEVLYRMPFLVGVAYLIKYLFLKNFEKYHKS